MEQRWWSWVVLGLMCWFVPASAQAGLFGGKKPSEVVGEEIEEKKSEEERRTEEQLAALAAAQSQRLARVVVLKWPNRDTDYTNETLIRNVKTRIARPDARFYPEIDLYQAGRKEMDRSVFHMDQRAMVPDASIPVILEAVDEVATIPWDALTDQQWGLKAAEMRKLAEEVWFIDRPELREPLFLLYSQLGRAAENSNSSLPPYYEQVGDHTVNYYWYLAAALANEDAALMSKLPDQALYASVDNYRTMLDQGLFPPLTLSFELEGEFDAEAFIKEYQLYINGLSLQINDASGLRAVNPGRSDVYLARKSDGHSLSDRITLDKLDEKIYFVCEQARSRMGNDFIEQLMEHPNECSPEVAGDILNYLAIYQRLHDQAEVYIAVPRAGSIAARNLFLWRWDRLKGQLQKVDDNTGGFPVRFVILVGAGLTFSGATYEAPTTEEIADELANNTDPEDPTAGAKAAASAAEQIPVPTPSGLPIFYHLRGHYGRLMVATGMEFAANLVGDANGWSSKYQTNTSDGKQHDVTRDTEVEVDVLDDGTCPRASVPNAEGTCTETVPTDVLRTRTWQRLVFLDIGVVFGRDAAVGFGPYLLARTGWYNTPHTVDLTGHGGIAARAPFTKEANGRVRPIVNLDLFGGVMVPFRDSLYIAERNKKLGPVIPTFGFTVSAGTTF